MNKRELKFRVWDIADKQWVNPNLLEVWDDSGKLEPFQFVKTGTLNPLYTPTENYVIQQYTGFKDKNGKEIYEGDLLKDDGDYLYEVYWLDSHASFEIAEKQELPDDYYNPRFIGIDMKKFEIVGNIFENQKLSKT